MLSLVIVLSCLALHLVAARGTRDAWGLAGDGDWNAAKSVICVFLWPIVLAGLFVDAPSRAARNELETAVEDMNERFQRQRDRNYELSAKVDRLQRELQLALPPPPAEGAYRTPGEGSS
jgi:hypothetical protein